MELKLEEPRKAIEWTIHQCRDFSVTVRGWTHDGPEGLKSNWNVYANVFDTHPFFGNAEAMMGLHFHGGATFDKLITTEPARGIQYDWQKKTQAYKIGSDYQHHMDHYSDQPIDDGMPGSVWHDAKTLAQELFDSSTAAGAA